MRARYAPGNRVSVAVSDCMQYLSRIPDDEASLILTSPPYNVGKEYEERISLAEYTEWMRRVVGECVRVTRADGSICWVLGNHVLGAQRVLPLDMHLHRLFDEQGLRLRNRIIWHFGHGLHCRKRFSGRHETVVWYTLSDRYRFNLDDVRVPQQYPRKRYYKGPNKGRESCHPLGKNPGDVWNIPNVKANHVEKTGHPCQFPVELAQRIILALTAKGELVVDPFVGTGSTLVAALLNERRSAGCDKVKAYVEIARRRVRLAAAGRLRIRGLES